VLVIGLRFHNIIRSLQKHFEMFRIQQSKINADPFLILSTVYLSDVQYLYVIHIRGWAGMVNNNAGCVSLLHREFGVQSSHLN
jgi:hypothetical protein